MGGSLAWPPMNCVSQPGQKAVPGDLFSGALSPELGVDLGDPSHRGRKNHMDKSLLSRRPLSETYCVRNVLDSYGDTPVCEAVYPTRGNTGPDSLFAALKLSFKQQLENPYNALPYL